MFPFGYGVALGLLLGMVLGYLYAAEAIAELKEKLKLAENTYVDAKLHVVNIKALIHALEFDVLKKERMLSAEFKGGIDHVCKKLKAILP